MKLVAFFAILLIYVNLSLQLPKLVRCPKDYKPPSSVEESCGIFTCLGTYTFVGSGCANYECRPGKYVGYIEPNNSLLYPACCGGPKCAD